MNRGFAVTWDYRCPFARNAQEAVVAGLRSGRPWDVRFLPFSLDQSHVPQDEPPVWDRPENERGSGVLALTWGIAVRDRFPDQFWDFHVKTFGARFDEGRKIDDETVLRDVATNAGLDPDAVATIVATGGPLDQLRAEHTEAVQRWDVFGVPTFIEGDEAVFVRLMERSHLPDLDRVLDMLAWGRLNEFKRTRIPR